ncbi:putative zinc finger matrin type 2 [Daphnia pulex]|uniref:Putative zinc finger matrin type 2 n=1 Tax=Daphnia pulex TaxID=6669 RepID=E9HJB9_DAPPU|nr:zinc finger matrin-type protein 2-like [Daphnia pulicaria]EFX68143.1 putative zinc finger matrin type 2 [Daphnia pulex]|eukprot:EFX68143.1 putative zinc finger matrin type 2 [Daphnia pulex]
MASSSSQPSDHRRKWDREEYEKLAAQRIRKEKEGDEDDFLLPSKRELLKQRDYKVDLESRLGKSVVITKTTPAAQGAGYYCNVCDCIVKDSINFLDHINGKKHQRNLGMSMKVERSSVEQVKKRFEALKKKKEEKTKEYDLSERIQELKEEEEKLREYRREKRKEKKRKFNEVDKSDHNDDNDDMAAMMGFSGFGTSKK